MFRVDNMEVQTAHFIMIFYLFISLTSFISGQAKLSTTESDLIVETWHGKMRGQDRGAYVAFEGIRYAEPPINDKRFEIAAPYTEKWEGIRDFTKFGNDCMQINIYFNFDPPILGEDDCLFLNLYTPKERINSQLPVIVYIHEGAFMYGSGHIQKPYNLMETKNFVYVNFNYRLGPLGFLSTEDAILPGNIGLKDQLIALNWVKNNVAAFGGDPEQVTIIGTSAGAASVQLHMMKPESKGLFKAAISHSGSALMPWVIQRHPAKDAEKLGELLQCPSPRSSHELKTCLKSLDSRVIVDKVNDFQKFFHLPFTVFGPVIESKESSQPFITEHPLNIIRSGNFVQVPWILGFSKDEGELTTVFMRKNGVELIETLDEIWFEIAPRMLFYQKSVQENRLDEISSKIKQYYLQGQNFTVENYFQLQKMATDRISDSGAVMSLTETASVSKAPVYSYIYTKTIGQGLGAAAANREDINFGPGHAADSYLIILPSEHIPEIQFTNEIKEMAHNFYALYESFGKTGVPTFGEFILKPFDFENGKLTFTEIGGPDDVRTFSVEKYGEVEFWESILPVFKNVTHTDPIPV